MSDTEKKIILDEGSTFLARVWKQTQAPVSYEKSIYVNGEWVKVQIGYDPQRSDHKPARRAEDKK